MLCYDIVCYSMIYMIYVTNDLSTRYNLLIDSILRLRPCERAFFFKKIVDIEEMRLFDDLPLDESLDKNEEYGVPLDERESDPRTFSFPLTIRKRGELDKEFEDFTKQQKNSIDITEKEELNIEHKDRKTYNTEL